MIKLQHFLKTHWQKTIAFALVLIFLVCSMTVMAKAVTNPQTYVETIRSIDEKKVTVLGVSAAIAGSATLLAAVPDDSTTPLADELMDLSSYLAIVVCILVLEKSLLTVFGAIASYALFPTACLLLLIFIINNKKVLLSWAIKIGILALAILLLVPVSMKLSDYIYEINQVEISQEADGAEEAVITEEEEAPLPWYKRLWNNITEAVTTTAEAAVDTGKKVLNEFVDAVSVFVIAYCAIPILIILIFLWLVKTLFGLNINVNINALNPKRLREKRLAKTESQALPE